MNFKIKVVENIGKISKKCFGKPGTVHEVKNGILTDLDGENWTNYGKLYNNIDDVNNDLYNNYCSYITLFELYEEESLKEKFLNMSKTEKLVFETNNGQKGVVFNDILLYKIGGYDTIASLNKNLEDTYNESTDDDINKVYKIKRNCDFNNMFNDEYLELIWERKSTIPEYTMRELQEKLGEEFKLIKG